MDNDIAERTKKEIDMMEIVFKVLTIKDKDKQLALDFFDMASNYFKDSKFFFFWISRTTYGPSRP
jgi:hypothetical protein